MLRYQDYFYSFDELGDLPTPYAIRKACSAEHRRQYAFDHFRKRHPADVRYALGYWSCVARNGVYSVTECDECLKGIAEALRLDESPGSHTALRELREAIEIQREEIIEEFGPDTADDNLRTSPPWRANDTAPIETRFKELAETVTPRGILGPPEEKEYWDLFQTMIRIAIHQNEMDRALTLLDEFERGRQAVKLKTLPDYDVQESILGYLAGQDLTLARARLQFWIDTTRVRLVSPLVSEHASFADVCEGLRWDTT